jgi:hypothetical protein
VEEEGWDAVTCSPLISWVGPACVCVCVRVCVSVCVCLRRDTGKYHGRVHIFKGTPKMQWHISHRILEATS